MRNVSTALLSAVVGLCSIPVASIAAPVFSFNAITAPSDISNVGTVVQAVNVGEESVPTITVNGITFTSNASHSLFAASGAYNIFDAGDPGTLFFTPGDASLQQLTNSLGWGDPLVPGTYAGTWIEKTLTVTAGENYKLQIILADKRDYHHVMNLTVEGASSSYYDIGGLGTVVAGNITADFTATAGTVTFRLTQGAGSGPTYATPALGAYVLSQVPEPTSLGIIALSGLGLMARRRKA